VAASTVLASFPRAPPNVLVVGAGAVGGRVAERLAPHARVTVVYHERAPSESFGGTSGARTVPFARLPEELANVDAVVTAVKSGIPCLRAAHLPERPLLLVDLGVPRNIDPDVRRLPQVRLVDLEELYARRVPVPGSGPQVERLESLARSYAEQFEVRLREDWIDALFARAEVIRRSEFANAQRFCSELTPEQTAAVERLTQRLVVRLLVPPVERLRALPGGPEGDRQRRAALEILRPDSDPL
jgi:glutamyl-tRNA reductase